MREVLCTIMLAAGLAAPAAASQSPLLSYTSPPTAQAQRIVLRRNGAELQLFDADTSAVLAHAPAASIRGVSVRGADQHDDQLTLDLSEALDLPDGIDYDGGAGGWDTLVLDGGRVASERIAQRTPHDGTITLDGLTIRYRNLEPVVDAVPAATFVVDGTAGADAFVIADGPGAGQATISSPTFESVTFANKTSVVIDGQGGGDTVSFANPTVPTGLQSLIVRNVASVTQSAAVNYAALGIDALGTVTLNAALNGCAHIEIQSVDGDIAYAAAGDVTVGGVSNTLAGVRVADSGSIRITAGGSVTLSDVDGGEVLRAGANAGEIQIMANNDIGADVANAAAISPTGLVYLNAGRDVLLGVAGSNYRNDVTADTLADLTAGRDVIVGGGTRITGVGDGGAIDIFAQRDFVLSGATGTGASLSAPGSSGQITIGAHRGVELQTGGAGTLAATKYVSLTTDRLVIGAGSGISGQIVDVFTYHASVDLGSDTDNAAGMLELSNAEANRIAAQILGVFLTNGSVTVSQPVSVPYYLDMLVDSGFTATGNGSLGARGLQFADTGTTARTWTFANDRLQISPGAPIPVSFTETGGPGTLGLDGGSGSDTFLITPSPTLPVFLVGGDPAPFAQPGDTLIVNQSGSAGGALAATQDGQGYHGTYTFQNRARVDFYSIETLAGATDLGVTLSDGVATTRPGDHLTYTLTASNGGALGVGGARVRTALAPALAGVTWTCSATAGSSCPAAGTGEIDQHVDLGPGGSATFTIHATVAPNASGSLTSTASVAPPAGITDPAAANDAASDTDTIAAAPPIAAAPALSRWLELLLAGVLAAAVRQRLRRR